MLIWEERQKAVCVGEAQSRGRVSCDGAIQKGWVWAVQGSRAREDAVWRDHPSMGDV